MGQKFNPSWTFSKKKKRSVQKLIYNVCNKKEIFFQKKNWASFQVQYKHVIIFVYKQHLLYTLEKLMQVFEYSLIEVSKDFSDSTQKQICSHNFRCSEVFFPYENLYVSSWVLYKLLKQVIPCKIYLEKRIYKFFNFSR